MAIPEKVPYFNAGVYLQNKKRIGKVDEILGKIQEIMFTVKMDPGVVSKSFQPDDLGKWEEAPWLCHVHGTMFLCGLFSIIMSSTSCSLFCLRLPS